MKGFDASKFVFGDFEDWLATGNLKNFSEKKHSFARLRESLRRNDDFVSMLEKNKRVLSSDDKREWLADGSSRALVI